MKRFVAAISLLSVILMLFGCSQTEKVKELPTSDVVSSVDTNSTGDNANTQGKEIPEAESSVPENLPVELATADDLTLEGGYLLLAELPEKDIALYCDNSENRSTAYIRHGSHFQAFEQKAWTDTSILPEMTINEANENGEAEITVKYLRHEGTYFNGETSEPGVVGEVVVYRWDGNGWTDIHFSSSGPCIEIENP